ncbi:uncharacterized protein N7511_009707 [Penicillium nucicola]|uniref:uncharacterized protein n=1 Tax=Penicillium nucicola TaxID=1850975 RepID=UPI00254506AE|nr:uncharacterized protein N7511_009707 [Penicillium nucicola]KAJ5748011.1 hypothetical protein N7511_009707 [Penicillium nucicola]
MGSYKSCQDRPGGGSSSSTDSSTSKSTAATALSDRLSTKHQERTVVYEERAPRPRDSVSTCASSAGSATDLSHEEPRYEVHEREEFFPLDAIPSTPSSFAPLFPSSRRLLIRHDDATIDGNMNLRVDTPVHLRDGSQRDVILFHLRMYDLFARKFSFRRYCRDSGREVCHSARREASSGHDKRPAFRRSWSTVFASLRPGSSSNGAPSTSTTTAHGDLKRQDSDFGPCHVLKSACHEPGVSDDVEAEKAPGTDVERPTLVDTILLEFSNYAHVELKRKGPGLNKKYEYEYWSTKYQWRREFRKEGDLHEVSYFLVDTRTSKTIAHLVPDTLAPLDAVEEESKGGWVPPSSLWISDPAVYERMPDMADVIVATGIVALVDDCIRRRWHQERRPSWMLPAQHLSKSLERMGPRRLIGQVLQRRGSA